MHGLGAGAATALVAGCSRKQHRAAHARLAPIDVRAERIIRTVVGLRPFRPSGYVVATAPLGDKLVVHNYGHGGCGVTLSWGTAELAVAAVLKSGRRDVAVLGSGAVGLATARTLQQAGLQPTIYARELPPATTSNVAGARWYPFDVFDKDVATAAFLDELWRVSHVAYKIFAAMGADYGVHRYPTYACRDVPFAKDSLLQLDSPIAELLPGLRDLPPAERPADYALVRTFETLMIEPGVYLPKVMDDYQRAGGTIVVRDFADAAALQDLHESLLVNCTGLGAAALFGDRELVPIKGQLSILPAQDDVDYVALAPDIYMFPRADGILLGGTFQRGDWTTTPDRAAEAEVLAKHQAFYRRLRTS